VQGRYPLPVSIDLKSEGMKATTKKSKNGGKNNSRKLSVRESKSTQAKRVRPLAPKQFVDIIEHMNDGVVVLDKDWHYVYVNQKAAIMLQRQKPADLIGKHIWTEYPEGVGQPFQLVYEKAMREQIPIVFEDHYEPWDLWFENRIYPRPDSLLILFTEITDRKRTEALLNERQYFLQKILDTEPGTVYIYDLEERRNVYVNHYWLLAFGYTEEETQAMGNELLGRIFHPDDLARISEHHENWRQVGEDHIREFDYRVRTKTGEWRWLHSREVPFVRDQMGRVKQILGITHDITQRKLAQEALHRSEQQLELIYDTVSDIIFLLSVEPNDRYRFVSVNTAFLQVTGLTSDQVIDRYADEIIPPSSYQLVFANYQRAIQERIPVTWEDVSEYPAGTKTAIVTVNAVYNEAGACTHLVGAVHDITERKRMEEVVLRERDFSDGLLNSLPGVLYFYDHTGKFLRWNRNFQIITGYAANEIARMHPLDFFADEEKEYIARRIQEVFENRQSNAEANLLLKSGKRIPYYFTGRRIDIDGSPYLIGMGIDISERKWTQDALAASEAELRALFASMDDVVLAIDREGVYQKIAPTNPNLLYKPPEELLGKTLRDIFPAAQAAAFLSSIRQVLEKGQTVHIEYQLPIQGRVVWFDAAISPMRPDSTLWMVRDITDRKEAEEGLRQLNEELEGRIAARTEELAAAMIKAQESDRLKSVFLATMSHELRTPLNSIIGFTGVILQGLAGPLTEEQTKQLNMIRDSARHLLALINDVLDISKIEAGQLKILKAPFDIRQAVESALRVVQPLAQKRNLQLETSIGPGVGLINGDRRRVEQVLINLVNNAVKFTERGTVRLECQIKDRWLETVVHDDGIGIKPEDMNKLFRPFQQIDTGLTRSHEGTGLGLAICKRLVTAMGGEITVESQWGIGSTFKFTLPV
jgi:PAS domain S-box-containing protein